MEDSTPVVSNVMTEQMLEEFAKDHPWIAQAYKVGDAIVGLTDQLKVRADQALKLRSNALALHDFQQLNHLFFHNLRLI